MSTVTAPPKPRTKQVRRVDQPARPPKQQPLGKRVKREIAAWSRWLHIYLSMFGLATILFFSATGVTLNHSDWFFKERIVPVTGSLPVDWLNTDASPPADWDGYDFTHAVDRLQVAERLREEHSLHGRVEDFLSFEDACEVTFEGPGYAAVATIDRASGEYTMNVASNDLVTIMNDLHKGRHTGGAWSWVIDISAVIGVLVSLTGFLLIFFLKLRRRPGLIAAAVGCVMLGGMYLLARG